MTAADRSQLQFVEFLLAQNVLQFGEFELKSGRVSPYFFNMGEISQGPAFRRLGEAYADAIVSASLSVDVLFGPAYKGIPIAVATAVALAERGVEVGVAYNRKEAKDHGEGGHLVGAPLQGRVLLIDDVLTSGKAIREALALIQPTQAVVCGAVIAMDRQEVVTDQVTAVQALAEEICAPVISISSMADLIQYLDEARDDPDAKRLLASMRDYQARFCIDTVPLSPANTG